MYNHLNYEPMKTSSFKYIFPVILALFVAGSALGQGKNASRLKVAYTQKSDNSRYLEGSIVVRVKRYEPLVNARIEILRIDNDTKEVIGNTITNKMGEFSFELESAIEDWLNENGEVEFSVAYSGNDTIRKASRSISIIPAYLHLDFIETDDMTNVEVLATRLNIDGTREGIPSTKIDVYVKSLFNPLLVGSATTDSLGMARLEFPNDLPGDQEGDIAVLAKINEDDNYGTILKEGEVSWGIPYAPEEVEQRGLGDTDAPLWMVYTLIVLLSAVWFHYMYVIFMIIKIKMAR